MKNTKKKNENKWKLLDIIIVAAAVCVLAVSGIRLAGIFLEYKAGTDAYGALQENYVVHDLETDGVQDAGVPETEQAGSQEEQVLFPNMLVDFEALREINQDLEGWIYIQALYVEYPLVQGSDNAFYLTHTFEKKENKAGAIFLDSEASAELTDYNTFIYGHNMKNGSMFGKLKKFVQDETLCEKDPYFYVFTGEKKYKYLIISYYVTTDGSETYFRPANEEEFSDYKKLIQNSTSYQCSQEIPEEAPVVTLSTCFGAAGGEQRFVVHGVLMTQETGE